ncbi:ASCH domain-containing protein [Vallitalea sediminicola]
MENHKYSQEDIDIFWTKFLKKRSMDKETKYLEVFHFELTEKWANELLRLVLIGQKKATVSSLLSYEIEGEPVPQVGAFSIVTDWDGVPRCVIKTTNIRVIPFCEITYDICKLEGEDDTLISWVNGHTRFFKEEGEQLGYEFSEDMPVVFEEFEVVYKV